MYYFLLYENHYFVHLTQIKSIFDAKKLACLIECPTRIDRCINFFNNCFFLKDVLTLELKYKLLRNILLIRCKLHAAAVISLQYMTIYKILWYYNILNFR